MVPSAYRSLLQDPRTRRLLTGLGASSLGDGMSTVTIAWLAVRIAPASEVGLFVGLAVAAQVMTLLGHSASPGRAWGLAAIFPSLLLQLAACEPQRPTTTFEPTIVGLIEQSNAGYSDIVTLDGGQTVEVGDARSLDGKGLSGGELFLGGRDQQGLWYQAARAGNPNCPFGISSNAWDDGDAVIVESGLRLKKASGFTGEPTALQGGPPPILCLDREGQAVRAE
jgi:hypothetical protein